MAIGKIITGQTFGNWLNTTNLLIDEVNQATDVYSQGKLVRWGAGGVITVNALTANTLTLSSGNTVNAVTNDWSNPIDDATLMTSNAIHHTILNADTIRLVHPTRVTSDIVSNTISFVAENNLVGSISNTATHFYNDVTFHKDMTVLGQKTELNVVTMEVEDSNIELNVGGASSKFTANNAGFNVNKTNAFMRLINTGTEFPEIHTANARLHNIYKLIELDVNGGGYVSKGGIWTNEKDRVIITYNKPFQSTIDANYGSFYNANNFVIGIGHTQSDTMSVPYDNYPFTAPSAYYRESTVLDPANYNGEIEYDISGTKYATYADYKNAFASAAPGALVTISLDPRVHRQLYYWIGEVDKTIYANTEVQFMKDSSGRSFTKIDFPLGFPIEENPTLEIYVGDEIRFEIDLQSNLNANAFFIGTTPYTDANRLHPTTVEMGGPHSVTSTTYEVDGTPYGTVVNLIDPAYEPAFQTGNWANVVFLPSQPGTYYYWATGNSADPKFQMGGQINVYPKNVNMGGAITVEYPMGKTVTKDVTYNALTQTFELDTIPADDVYLEAGDTVQFNIQNTNHNANVFVLSSTTVAGSELDYTVDNVLYTSDANSEYRIWSDYENKFSSNNFSNVFFTPFTAGTYYYYANNTPVVNVGRIIVSGTRPYDLGAFHISTDDATATIENPIKFVVTQNKFPIMELDGELADFFGTKNGIRLPNNSYDYTPSANGIIRYNNALHLFEGYTQGQWRGLGGVVDLNQDTYVETDDFNDTIYFVANSANVSQMRETDMFFETNRTEINPGLSHKVSNIRVESNANTLEYSINVDGSANTFDGIGWNLESGDAGIKVDHRGVEITGKGYLQLPYGEAVHRPYFAANGMIRVVEKGVQVVDSTGSVANVDVLEMYMEDRWQPLSVLENEYTYTVSTAGSNTVSFTNLYTPFTKDDIEVHVNGLKIERTDFDIVNTPNNVYQITYSYTAGAPGDYPYTAGITSLDTGDKLTISYTGIQGLNSNSAPVAIGVPDPLNPGSFIPTVGVNYYVDGVLKTTFADYVSNTLSSNTSTANTIDIEYTASSPGTFYLYALDSANNTVGGGTNIPINVTGQTSYTSNLVFQTNRNVGQIINVKHSLGRKVGVNRIDVLSRSELANGLATNVRFSGQVNVGAGQPSTSTTTGALVVNGGLGMSGDLFVGRSVTELSAGELKTDISNIDSALDKIISMKGVEFSWKDDSNNSREYGLIAEDVAKIAPSLVSFNKEKPQGVKYSKVVALLIEAMKQQQNEIELLKSQLPKKRGRKSNSTKE